MIVRLGKKSKNIFTNNKKKPMTTRHITIKVKKKKNLNVVSAILVITIYAKFEFNYL